MIFEGVLSLGQLPTASNMHNLSTRRNASLCTPVANQTRQTILIVESPDSNWVEMKVAPVLIVSIGH